MSTQQRTGMEPNALDEVARPTGLSGHFLGRMLGILLGAILVVEKIRGYRRMQPLDFLMVAGDGFEPSTFGL